MTDSSGSDLVRVCVSLLDQDKDEVLIPLCADTIPTPKARGWFMFRRKVDANARTPPSCMQLFAELVPSRMSLSPDHPTLHTRARARCICIHDSNSETRSILCRQSSNVSPRSVGAVCLQWERPSLHSSSRQTQSLGPICLYPWMPLAVSAQAFRSMQLSGTLFALVRSSLVLMRVHAHS